MIRRKRAGVVSVGFDLRRYVADVKLVMKVVTYFSHEGIAWMAARHDEVDRERSLRRAHRPDVKAPAASYAKNETRSIKPGIFVAIDICTHLGCVPTFRPDVAPADLGPDWFGGFFCPCHQLKFDLAGRVYRGVPAPTNLVVPPHEYMSDTRIVIGEDTTA